MTRRSRTPGRNLNRARALWLLGFIGLIFGHVCLIARIEPFYTSVYTFLWWPVIFVIDYCVYRLRKTSMLTDRWREFWLLALWSTPAWLFFELVNFRIQNWYYIQVPVTLTDGAPFLALAFTTVLPGVFELMELWIGLLEKWTNGRGIRQKPIRVTPRTINTEITIGALMLLLTLAWPNTFFCLAWGFVFCILDPICYLKGGRSILGQLKRGDATRLIALLLAGFVSGGIWEGWNLFSRSKWIYTVPGFESFKIGEMPLLGFLGFPPFVLECYVIANFICLFRRERHWESPDDKNRLSSGMPRKTARRAWAITIALSLLTTLGIFVWTESSYSIPIHSALEPILTSEQKATLQKDKTLYGYQFVSRYSAPPPGFDTQTYDRVRRLSSMSELRGIGFHYAIAMEHLGIEHPADLADWNRYSLSNAISRITSGTLQPIPRRTAVWTRAGRDARKAAE